MLSAVYEACDPKPDIDALTKFYREFFLRQRTIIAALKRVDMLKPSEVKRQITIGERSQNATHPFTWQFKVRVEDENRYTAVFTRCGIYDYLNSRGMAHIVENAAITGSCVSLRSQQEEKSVIAAMSAKKLRLLKK